MEDELTLAALRMALERRMPAPGLAHHSDRGVQYASLDYTDLRQIAVLLPMHFFAFSGTIRKPHCRRGFLSGSG